MKAYVQTCVMHASLNSKLQVLPAMAKEPLLKIVNNSDKKQRRSKRQEVTNTVQDYSD